MDTKFGKLVKMLGALGAMTEERLHLSLNAVKRRDADLGRNVRKMTVELEHLALDIEDHLVSMLGRRSLHGDEIWFAVSALKISRSFAISARIALDISREAALLSGVSGRAPVHVFEEAWGLTQNMLSFTAGVFNPPRDFAVLEVADMRGSLKKAWRKADTSAARWMACNPDDGGKMIILLSVSALMEAIASHMALAAEEAVIITEGRRSEKPVGVF